MSYSLDLRERAVRFIERGGSKIEAHRQFGVSLWCIRNWCKRPTLSATYSYQGRPRKVDLKALTQHIQEYPDKLLRERAKDFNVHTNSIWHACRVMKITHKKNTSIHRKKPLKAHRLSAKVAFNCKRIQF